MKVKRFFMLATLCVGLFCIGTSCEQVPDDDDLKEINGENGGSGDEPGGGSGGSGNEPGGDNGGTVAAADIFKAFDKVDNEFWYQEKSGSSYVVYGSGRQSTSNVRVITWHVVSATANEATVNTYLDFDFDKPDDVYTFSRDSDGSLLYNGKKVTNTVAPEFLSMNFGKKGSYEWKQMYNNGEYTNVFYTKGNAYTTTKLSQSITEIWNKYGFFSSKYSDIADDATIGSYYKDRALMRAKTAYNSFGNNTKPDGVSITGMEISTYLYDTKTYFKENPSAQALEINFTHNGLNTCAYCFGMYLKGNDGVDAWFPVYKISDIHDYIKGLYDKNNQYYPGGDKLVKPPTDISKDSKSLTLILTPAAVELGKSMPNKILHFCIFALGYGLDMVSTIDNTKAVFGIDFSEPGTSSEIVRKNSAPAPVSLKQKE